MGVRGVTPVSLWRSLLTLSLSSCYALSCAAQTHASDKLNVKSLESAASFAQSLAQWEFIMIGGSLLVLVGTSYHRPPAKGVRFFYLFLFPAAWFCLVKSIYMGLRAQEVYLAYLLLPATTLEGATVTLNSDIGAQIQWLWYGLFLFLTWLVIYLLWWTLTDRVIRTWADS